MDYPWYKCIRFTAQILQGIFVLDCPIIVLLVSFEGEQSVDVKLLDTIIMSQSCDIENEKTEIVLVCPYYKLEDFLLLHPPSRDGGKGEKKRVSYI